LFHPPYTQLSGAPAPPHPFPTRRSSDLATPEAAKPHASMVVDMNRTISYRQLSMYGHNGRVKTEKTLPAPATCCSTLTESFQSRSEEHTSELQSRFDLVCRLLLEKKKDS